MEKNNTPGKKTAGIIALFLCAVMVLGLIGSFGFGSRSKETAQAGEYLSDPSLSPEEKLSLAISEHNAANTQKVTDAEITVYVGEQECPALYTGNVLNNVPSGSGLYKFSGPDGDWTFTGTLNGASVSSGKVTDYPYAFELSNEIISSKYIGNLSNGMPQGLGTFLVTTPDGEITLNGYYDSSRNFNGDVENYNLSFDYNGTVFNGRYNGSLASGVPEGEGSFKCEGDPYYCFTGTWKDGSPFGPGRLSTSNASFFSSDGSTLTAVYEGGMENGLFSGEGTMTIGDEDSEMYSYSGGFQDGSFSGEGTLSYASSDGSGYTYTGGFSEGAYHGHGELIFDNPDVIRYIGNFEHGSYRPTPVELITALCSDAGGFTLPEQAKEFISANGEQLLSHDTSELNFGDGFSYYAYSENPENPDDRCFKANFRVVSINEYSESSFGTPVSEILGYADNGERVYYGFYLGHIDDFESRSILSIIAYPLAFRPYHGVDGSEIPALRFIAFDAY